MSILTDKNKNNYLEDWEDIYKKKSQKYNSHFWIPNLIAEEFSEVLGSCIINFTNENNEIIKNIKNNNSLNDLLVQLVKNTCLTSNSAIYFFKIKENIYLKIANNIFSWVSIGENLLSIILITNIIDGTYPSLEILKFKDNKIVNGIIKSQGNSKNDEDYNFLPIEYKKTILKYGKVIPCVIWFWSSDKSDMFSKIPSKLFDLCNNILYQMDEDLFYGSSKLYISQLAQITGKSPKYLEKQYKFGKVITLDRPAMFQNQPFNLQIGAFQTKDFITALNYNMNLIRDMCKANKSLNSGGTHNKHTAEVLMNNITYYNNIINQKNRLEKVLNKLFEKIFESYSNNKFEGLTLEFNPILQTQIEGIGNTKLKLNEPKSITNTTISPRTRT